MKTLFFTFTVLISMNSFSKTDGYTVQNNGRQGEVRYIFSDNLNECQSKLSQVVEKLKENNVIFLETACKELPEDYLNFYTRGMEESEKWWNVRAFIHIL